MGRFTFTLCRPTGESLDELGAAKSRKYSRRLNGVDTATVVVALDDPLASTVLPGQSRLKVWRARSDAELALNPALTNDLIFYGFVPVAGYQADGEANELRLSFFDPLHQLTTRTTLGPAFETYSGVDQGLILWGLIAEQNARTDGDTWIRQGGVTTGILRDRTYEKSNVWQLIENMTQVISGCDVGLDPVDGWAADGSRVMGNFRAYARRGIDRPDVHFQYGPDLDSNCEGMTLAYAPVISAVDRTGVEIGTGQAIEASIGPGFDPATIFGIIDDYAQASGETTLAALTDEVNGVFFEHSLLTPLLTVGKPTAEAPQPLEHYDVGDTCRASFVKGAVNVLEQTIRVHGIDLDLGQDGTTGGALLLAGGGGA